MVNWGMIYQWRLRVNIRDVFYASVSHVLNLTAIGEIANAFNPVLAIPSPPNHLCFFSLPLVTSILLIFSFIIVGVYCLPAATDECKLLKGWYIFHSLDISDNERKINKTAPDT